MMPMVALISSMSSPAPAPGDDPAMRRAIKCGFVVSRSHHASYFDWCIANDRPYVAVAKGWPVKVMLVMRTCSWRLSVGRRRYLCELGKKRTGNASDFHYDDDGSTFTFYGVPAERAELMAWNTYEAALDSRPSGRGEDEECLGV